MKQFFLALFLFSCGLLQAQNDAWHITATNTENYTGIVASNGRIGMLSSTEPFKIQHTVLNNVYDVSPVYQVSQIVHGMDFANLDLYVDGEKLEASNLTNWSQTIDMKGAAITTRFDFGTKASMSCTVYALHRLCRCRNFGLKKHRAESGW